MYYISFVVCARAHIIGLSRKTYLHILVCVICTHALKCRVVHSTCIINYVYNIISAYARVCIYNITSIYTGVDSTNLYNMYMIMRVGIVEGKGRCFLGSKFYGAVCVCVCVYVFIFLELMINLRDVYFVNCPSAFANENRQDDTAIYISFLRESVLISKIIFREKNLPHVSVCVYVYVFLMSTARFFRLYDYSLFIRLIVRWR